MGTNGIKIGILVQPRLLVIGDEPPKDADLLLSMAAQIDEAGLDSVWVGDSLMYNPRPEAFTVLTAMAARTQRVRLGTAVLIAALRHPVWLADVMASVDLISKGRLVVGVGVGANFTEAQRDGWRAEWSAAGADPSKRVSRLEEVVEIVRRLGTGETVSFEGRHFSLDSVSVVPRPVQKDGVPVLFVCDSAARRETQLRRVARFGDGAIFGTIDAVELERAVDKLRTYVDEEGRDFSKMEVVTSVCVNLDRDERRAAQEADRLLMGYYRQNYWGDSWGPFGHPDRTVEAIRKHVELGIADTIIVRLASFDQQGQLDIFLNEVVPALQ